MLITLSVDQLGRARAGGAARRRWAQARRLQERQSRNGHDRGVLDDILGAAGEIAVVEGWLHRSWGATVGDLRLPDAHGGLISIQVRTRSRPSGRLFWRPGSDARDHAFVLVTTSVQPNGGMGHSYHLRGWLWGHECRSRGNLVQAPEWTMAYFVDGRKLRPLQELEAMVQPRITKSTTV